MSILIKGMEMPKSCVYRENGHLITCPLYDIDGYCGALNTEASHKEEEMHPDCPLIEVPKHGRLIDADELLDDCIFSDEWFKRGMYAFIGDAPTIIPADKEG